MYAIRSYYAGGGSDPAETAAGVRLKLRAALKEHALKRRAAQYEAASGVITSYSIHYTKLYDARGSPWSK